MEGIQGIQDHSGRAGAGQGGGNFFADVAGFSDAKNDDFSTVFDSGFDQLNRPGKILAEAG